MLTMQFHRDIITMNLHTPKLNTFQKFNLQFYRLSGTKTSYRDFPGLENRAKMQYSPGFSTCENPVLLEQINGAFRYITAESTSWNCNTTK